MKKTGPLTVVLVRTKYSSNIGACARAIANMGADRLVLIDPQCEIDNEAHQKAAGAQDVLKELVSYPTWNDFYAAEGSGLRIGFTRRDGKQRQVWPFKERLTTIKANDPKVFSGPIYFVFGPENHGLNAEDLSLMNHRCCLPCYGRFTSMNIAQAVLLAIFVFRDFLHEGKSIPSKTQKKVTAATKPLFFPDQTIRNWITAMGFNINARRASAYITLRRLLLQNATTENDLRVLEAILQQNIRKLNANAQKTARE